MEKKLSFYNFYIPYKEFEIYMIYNSLTNGLCEIEWEKGEKLEELHLQNLDEKNNFLTTLSKNEFDLLESHNMIIDKSSNEKEQIENLLMNRKNFINNDKCLTFTICPTLGCNLACLYCYEGEKKVRTITDDTIEQLLLKSKEIIEKKSIEKIHIIWLGGEPLLFPDIIKNISDKFIKLSEDHGITYDSSIITNGTKLGKEQWDMLVNANVKSIQVSIDGTKKTHDKKRPLKGTGSSFDMIMENLKHYSNKLHLTIRIHSDKEVIPELPMLLNELEMINLWPQNAKNVYLDLVEKTYYEENTKEDKSIYYTADQFYEELFKFKQMQFDYYNKWATRNNKELAKRMLDYPKISMHNSFCLSAHSPNTFVIDATGYIHKCWVPVNTENARIEHISQLTDTNKESYKKWEGFEKFKVEECNSCKFFPICEATCVNDFFVDKVFCTKWKYSINEGLKNYYQKKYVEADNSFFDINDNRK